jgi:hypothetical protein
MKLVPSSIPIILSVIVSSSAIAAPAHVCPSPAITKPAAACFATHPAKRSPPFHHYYHHVQLDVVELCVSACIELMVTCAYEESLHKICKDYNENECQQHCRQSPKSPPPHPPLPQQCKEMVKETPRQHLEAKLNDPNLSVADKVPYAFCLFMMDLGLE